MPRFEGGSGREGFRYETPIIRIEARMETAEAGIGGRMRETTFEEAQTARLPSFVQLSRNIGMCFASSGKSVTRHDRIEGDQSVELFEGRLVTWDGIVAPSIHKQWTNVTKMEAEIQKIGFTQLILPDVPVLFTGSLNGNYARDGRLEDPEDPSYNFAIVGIDINASRKIEDGSGLLALAHELGHARILLSNEDRDYVAAAFDKKSKFPRDRKQIEFYAEQFYNNALFRYSESKIKTYVRDLSKIKDFYGFLSNENFDREFRLYHERHAWADGFAFLRSQGKLRAELQEVGQKRAVDYAQRCLDTYSMGYNDERFTKGRRAIDGPHASV